MEIVADQYNIGHICTRQQCDRGLSDKVAMRWISATEQRSDYTFADLDQASNRCANLLASLGCTPGDIVFTFLPKCPEQFFLFLGALKLQAICGTLFANFGDDAILDRLGASRAKGVVTKKSFLKKLQRIRPQMPDLAFILVVDSAEHLAVDILSLPRLMGEASADFLAPLTPPETPSVLHYTSGSTGKPKGVLHTHRSILHQSLTTASILGLQEDDNYWCTADQGWVTGTSYGIIGPWSLGVTQIHFGGNYDAKSWFELLQNEGINVWYTAPTALRMLMREDDALYRATDLSALRHISSVGEPLNPEVIHWGRRILQKEIYDTWFQTETGAIMIANRPGLLVRPGSMGLPVVGCIAAILDDAGVELADGEAGHLCLRLGWPSMFTTYLGAEAAYQSKFRDGWYYTGDTALRDSDGYFWFRGRSDDVINTAGHLISPFEIESTLLEVPEVAESGAIGVPDELLYEKVIAFVALHRQATWSPELEVKIRLYVSNRLSTIATPQVLICVESIPKNKSGKIMRRVLKARYLGEDPGDISTLED